MVAQLDGMFWFMDWLLHSFQRIFTYVSPGEQELCCTSQYCWHAPGKTSFSPLCVPPAVLPKQLTQACCAPG